MTRTDTLISEQYYLVPHLIKKKQRLAILDVLFLRVLHDRYHNLIKGGVMESTHKDLPDSTVLPNEFLLVIDFDDLAKRAGKRLRNFIRRRIWNPEEVEDIWQASFLEALRCRDKFRGGSAPETWLFGIAMNLMRSHMRKSLQWQQYNGGELFEEKEVGKCEDPCDIVMRQTALEHISHAYELLPLDMRKTLFLVIEQGISYQEAAIELGVPIGTVRSRLNRARQMLKDHIDRPPTRARRYTAAIDHPRKSLV